MDSTTFQKLTKQEAYELSLCGISSESQLLKADINTILKDLENAQKYFPDRHFSLTKEKLESLLGAQAILEEPAETSEAEETGEADLLEIENIGPTTGFRRSCQERSRREIQKTKKAHQKILHSTVRTSHPWTTLFAAISTLLLIVPAVSIVVLLVMMATDTLPDISLKLLVLATIIAPSLPYLLFSRLALCPVCHIRTFTYDSYTRNRAAHYIPGLGYNTATALSILFRFRFICPGCGTPIRLTRSKSKGKNH